MIVELYNEADFAAMRLGIRRWRIFQAVTAALALAVCLVLIANTRTINADRMEQATILISTLAGWGVLYGQLFYVTPLRREIAHALMLRGEEREKFTGEISVTGERIVIRKSITARRVEVRTEEETIRLMVCESRARALEGLGTATLYAAHHYVAAYEVTE